MVGFPLSCWFSGLYLEGFFGPVDFFTAWMPRSMRSKAVCCTQTCVSTPKRMASCRRQKNPIGGVGAISCSNERPCKKSKQPRSDNHSCEFKFRASSFLEKEAKKVANFQTHKPGGMKIHANHFQRQKLLGPPNGPPPGKRRLSSSQLPLNGCFQK